MVIHCVFGIITFLKQLVSNKVAKDKFKICTKKVSKNKQKTHFSENPLRNPGELLLKATATNPGYLEAKYKEMRNGSRLLPSTYLKHATNFQHHQNYILNH